MDTKRIEISRYRNLRLLAWQLHRDYVEGAEAFAIHEGEWRYLDPDRMEPQERRLTQALADEYGHGVLNV